MGTGELVATQQSVWLWASSSGREAERIRIWNVWTLCFGHYALNSSSLIPVNIPFHKIVHKIVHKSMEKSLHYLSMKQLSSLETHTQLLLMHWQRLIECYSLYATTYISRFFLKQKRWCLMYSTNTFMPFKSLPPNICSLLGNKCSWRKKPENKME